MAQVDLMKSLFERAGGAKHGAGGGIVSPSKHLKSSVNVRREREGGGRREEGRGGREKEGLHLGGGGKGASVSEVCIREGGKCE